jgi:hypothetical protein
MLQTIKLPAMLTALLLACGTWLAAAPAAAAQDEDAGLKTVTATGQGATKDQARDDALRKAVEKGAGVVITSRTETLDHAVAFDRIVSRSEGYVKSFTEGEVKKDAATDLWNFTITAQVATGKIKDDWAQAEGQPHGHGPDPRDDSKPQEREPARGHLLLRARHREAAAGQGLPREVGRRSDRDRAP